MECLVSKESLLPRWWGNETLKFGIKRVDGSNSDVSIVSPSSELINFVIFRKKITKLTFREFALGQSESTS